MTVQGEIRTALPTGIVTFLLTDVEDSTRLWEAAPDEMGPAIDRQYAILDAAVRRHGGARPQEQGEGDSVVAVFASPAEALTAAFDAQLALRAEPWPDGARLRVRMAVHTGEARLRDAWNYVGPTIIRCARLRGLAAGGQVVVSSATRELAQHALPEGAELVELGERVLKGIDVPERVFGLQHPDLGGTWDLATPPQNLPRALTPFVGRAEDITRIGGMLDGGFLVTLAGPGGAGKTRLALEVAGRRVEAHADGVFLVELARVEDAAHVARHVLGALGVAEEASRPADRTLTEHLRARAVLVVLDNCEHVLDTAARTADQLLRECPHVKILATSREPLGVPGERIWAVDGLPTSDAAALFGERAAAVRADFALDAARVPTVEDICRGLEGMPLAIELAAARLRHLALDDIAAGLGSSLQLLSHGPRTAEVRHRTLRASLDWSHGLLDDGERCLYRRFAVFAGGARREGVERVCAGGPVKPGDVDELLGALVEKSLLRMEESVRGVRYRMLEPVRQHAIEQLDADEGRAVRRRHLELGLELADLVSAQPELDPVLPDIEEELGNLRAALEHALETDPPAALRMTAALGWFWVFGGRAREALAIAQRVLDACDPTPSSARASVLVTAATLSQFQAQYEQAYALAQEALACAEACGDEREVGRAAHVLGAVIGPAEPAQGLALSERGVEALRRAGTDPDVAWALIGLGINLAWQDDFARAAAAGNEAIGLTSDRAIAAWREVLELWRLIEQGELDAGETAARRGRAASGGRVPMVDDALDQAAASARVWRGEAAVVLAGAEDALQRTAAESPLITLALQSVLALASLAVGDVEDVRRRTSMIPGEWMRYHAAEGLGIRGLAELLDGDVPAARRQVAALRDLARHIGNARFGAVADVVDGRAALEEGRLDEARTLLQRALGAFAEGGVRLRQPPVLEALGAVAAAEEDWAVAARLLAAGGAAYAELGSVRIPENPARWNPLRDVVAAADPDAWAEGEALSLDAAVAYARRGRGPRERPLRGWASLTPTEAEVAQLAAGGSTNPEIGEALFMSRATVKRHLARAFDKLGVANRTELARWVAEHRPDE